MNVLIVLAHPEPRSFNGQLTRQLEAEFRHAENAVRVSDLYRMGFDPVDCPSNFPLRVDSERFDIQSEQRFSALSGNIHSDVKTEINKLLWADYVIFQFPLWWFGLPAMLKGWFDRVLIYGGVYSSRQRFETGIGRGKRAILSTTLGSSASSTGHNGQEGETRLILWPVNQILNYLGYTVLQPNILTGIRHGTTERSNHKEEMASTMQAAVQHLLKPDLIAKVPFNVSGDWDEKRRLKPEAPVHSPFVRHNRNWLEG